MNLCGHSARLSSPTKKDRDNEDSLQADNVIIGFELLFGTIEVHQEGLQSADKEENLAEILKLYHNFKSVPGFSQRVTHDQIKTNSYNLNISLYVAQIQNQDELSLEESLDRLKNTIKEVKEERTLLITELKKWGLNVEK